MNTGGLGRRQIETKKQKTQHVVVKIRKKIEEYKNNLKISGGVMIKKKTTNGRI